MKKNYLKSFCARFLTLLVLALLSTNLAWGEDVTDVITQDSFDNVLNSGYNNYTCTGTSGATYLINFYKNGNTLMNFKKTTTSSGLVVTGVPSGKKIKSVTATFDNQLNIYWSNTAYSSSGITTNSDETSAVSLTTEKPKSPTSTATTFRLYSPSTAATVSKITIVWEDATEPTGPSLSVSPTTIDFGEVYQNAEVDAEEVTVTFANLTTNDVAAAITGSAFDINKTGSFTSGDKITITPKTATIGEYEETLTVSGATDGLEKTVTVTMNVVAAPVTEKYTLVTDASTLKAGDVIVIGATKDKNSYVAGALEGDFLSSKEATIENSILSASEAVEFTLGGEAGSWTLTSTEGTLGATDVKKLAYGSGTTTWTISIAEGGDATISSTTESYGRFLYNASSPRFTTYTSATSASMLLPQIYRKEVSAKITSTGYATFSSDYALNLSNLPEGLTAYKATTADNGKVHMVAVEEAVAASTGLFLQGEAGETYAIPVTASGDDISSENILKPTTGEALAEDNYVYVIVNNAFQPLGQATVVSKGKAYIPKDAITTSGKLEITFNEPTGITSYENDNDNENLKAMTVYNLNGMRVNPSTGSGQAYKGIVIMNGKKYINK